MMHCPVIVYKKKWFRIKSQFMNRIHHAEECKQQHSKESEDKRKSEAFVIILCRDFIEKGKMPRGLKVPSILPNHCGGSNFAMWNACQTDHNSPPESFTASHADGHAVRAHAVHVHAPFVKVSFSRWVRIHVESELAAGWEGPASPCKEL